MARVARPDKGRTSPFIADQPTRRAVVPVLFHERATRRGERTFRRDLSLRLLLLFLDREGLFFLP